MTMTISGQKHGGHDEEGRQDKAEAGGQLDGGHGGRRCEADTDHRQCEGGQHLSE
jgi:hypothetical protein